SRLPACPRRCGGWSAALLFVGPRPQPRGRSHYAANAKSIVQCTIAKSIGDLGEIFTDARRIEHEPVEETVRTERQRALVRGDAMLGIERALDLETRPGKRRPPARERPAVDIRAEHA